LRGEKKTQKKHELVEKRERGGIKCQGKNEVQKKGQQGENVFHLGGGQLVGKKTYMLQEDSACPKAWGCNVKTVPGERKREKKYG